MCRLRVLVMRHARSDFNEITIRHMPMHNTTKGPFLRDSKLSYKGMSDCRELAQTFGALGVKLVFVSPLRRCLETALHLFERVEPAMRPHIVVNPNLMERISRISELPTFYIKAMKMPEYRHFDFDGMRQVAQTPLWDVPLYDEHRELLRELTSLVPAEALKAHVIKFAYFRNENDSINRLIDMHLHGRIEAFEEEFKLFIANYRLRQSLAEHQVLLISHFNWIIQYVQMRGQDIPDLDSALLNLKTFSLEIDIA